VDTKHINQSGREVLEQLSEQKSMMLGVTTKDENGAEMA
jgi:hypothetical protein